MGRYILDNPLLFISDGPQELLGGTRIIIIIIRSQNEKSKIRDKTSLGAVVTIIIITIINVIVFVSVAAHDGRLLYFTTESYENIIHRYLSCSFRTKQIYNSDIDLLRLHTYWFSNK